MLLKSESVKIGVALIDYTLLYIKHQYGRNPALRVQFP